MSLDDFRIVFAHGSRADDDVRMSDIFSSVAFEDFNPHVLQAIGYVRAFQIGAGDTKAEIHQYLGNAGHADTTDAYEMNMLDPTKHFFLLFVPFCGPTLRSYRLRRPLRRRAPVFCSPVPSDLFPGARSRVSQFRLSTVLHSILPAESFASHRRPAALLHSCAGDRRRQMGTES